MLEPMTLSNAEFGNMYKIIYFQDPCEQYLSSDLNSQIDELFNITTYNLSNQTNNSNNSNDANNSNTPNITNEYSLKQRCILFNLNLGLQVFSTQFKSKGSQFILILNNIAVPMADIFEFD